MEGAVLWTRRGAMLAAVAWYAWFATGLRPFTLPALVAVLSGGGVALVVGARLRSLRPLPLDRPRRIDMWIVLSAALLLWEVASFLQHPRVDHPTLSSLTNTVFQTHSTRAVGLLAWLAVGVGIARR